MRSPKAVKVMNKEIEKYDIFVLNTQGQLIYCDWIKSTADYNHGVFNLHHYIEFQSYSKNPQWYEERDIKQKLILMRINTHEQLHFQAVKNMTDKEFEKHYKISRWELLFNKKHSTYGGVT